MTMPGPVFLAGSDRSGIGLLGESLNSHPQISISRRTRFWSLYYERFGDLSEPSNLSQAVHTMMQYTRMRDLTTDPDRVIQDFQIPGADASYGRLLDLIQKQNLMRVGKSRWGDKTLNAEHHADAIYREYPTARVIHVIRDPRDRYASQLHHRGASRGKVGAGSALWLSSVRSARRNQRKHPESYKIVRYEDLASRPQETIEDVCHFLDEPFDARMLTVSSQPWRDDDNHGVIGRNSGYVTTSIGRFGRDLAWRDIALIQLVTRKWMTALGYERITVRMSLRGWLRFVVLDAPLSLGRMVGWWINMVRRQRSGGSPSERRTAPVV
jgi:hypothetical protein